MVRVAASGESDGTYRRVKSPREPRRKYRQICRVHGTERDDDGCECLEYYHEWFTMGIVEVGAEVRSRGLRGCAYHHYYIRPRSMPTDPLVDPVGYQFNNPLAYAVCG